MARVALLKIGQGSFEQGFAVTLQIREDQGSPIAELEGRLPANLEIESLYLCWQQTFRSLTVIDRSDDWQIDQNLVTHRSTREDIEACRQFAKALETNMTSWLQSTTAQGWQKIRERFARELASYSDRLRLVVQAREPQLWKLPWQVWDLLSEYPQVGIGYSLPDFEQEKLDQASPTSKSVRILAVLGNAHQLDLEPDEAAIEQLKQTDTLFLYQPTAQELIRHLREGWDLFFFAGHSQTEQQTGRIALNDQESLEIDQFRNALREAIRKGLKIAIFNSCDGLGLAQRLANLNIPIVIFMQEKVPDSVAHAFLREFLSEYAKDQSLYTAVRRSQERLEEFQHLPGATWLPILYQNPAEVPPTWQMLQGRSVSSSSRTVLPKIRLRFVLLTSLLMTSLIVWTRSQGVFQSLELQAYDHFMRHQSIEPIDQRLLIIGADEEDLRRYRYPIPDIVLAQLLAKLKQANPSAIGVDIVRDQPVGTGQAQLIQQLKDSRTVPICSIDHSLEKSIAPPPNIPEEQLGFVDLQSDEQQTNQKDSTIRRYLLSRSPNPVTEPSPCSTSYSFALQLAARYFRAKNIAITVQADEWKFGSVLVHRLAANSSGYQNLDDRGNQSLIRYRRTLDPQQIARQVTIREVLNHEFKLDLAKDRVILIGVTASSIPDLHHTPFGRLRGLKVHAQMVSQILSAVEDQRRFIGWLPVWGDGLWILSWSLAGGLILWQFHSRSHQSFALSCAIAALYSCCWFAFIQGIWIPFIPSTITLLLTSGTLAIAHSFKKPQEV